MATSHEVRVTIGTGSDAVEITAWDEIAITLDMMRPGNPWTVTTWRTGRGAAWSRVRDAAKLFSPATIAVDGAVQVRGLIERIRDGADRGGAPFTISGRDLLATALASDVDPHVSLRGATLEEVFRRALEPLGIPVEIGADAGDVREIQAGSRPGAHVRSSSARTHRRRQHVDRFKPRVGERLWQFLETLARRHGYLIYVAPFGDGVGLVIDRPRDSDPPVAALTRRRNPDGSYSRGILSGTLDLDATDVPTDITVFGHGSLTARDDSRHRATVENDRIPTRRLAEVHPPRHRYIQDSRARTPQIAEQRARHELAKASANVVVYEAIVQGWRAAPGRLWTINTPVTIDDEIPRVRGNWLATQVHFQRARNEGHKTRLRFVPPGAIDVEPDPEV